MNREICPGCGSRSLYGFGLCNECWERIHKGEDYSLEEMRKIELEEALDEALNEKYAKNA